MPQGYYRFPTLQAETVVFVSEDDLWSVPVAGGIPRRLTSNLGEVSHPSFSPDGQWLAFVGRDEGQAEIYCMPALGGPARRLTYLGGSRCFTTGWTADGQILFANNAGHWESRFTHLYQVSLDGAMPKQLPFGPVRSAAFGPNGEVALERSHVEPAVWKRYRGGANGQLWVSMDGGQDWRRLLVELSNLSAPLWLALPEEALRLYFISDHEGAGNLYSCRPSGDDLRQHTQHTDFYARNPSSDGRCIVYHAGGDLYWFDPATGTVHRIEIDYHSPQVHRNRKFTAVNNYLEHLALHPRGQSLALTARGKLFSLYNWEGAVLQHTETSAPHFVAGIADPGLPAAGGPESSIPAPEVAAGEAVSAEKPAAGIRYRLPAWLHDGRRLAAVTDSPGEETFVIFHVDPSGPPPVVLPRQEWGRALRIVAHPSRDVIAFSNHRYELLVLDLESGELRIIDRGKAAPIYGFCWSPDGEWLAYSVSISLEITVLKLWNAAGGETTQITRPVLRDVHPAFDPLGRYLYFLSYRSFTPVYDALHFELSFPFGVRPYLITLNRELPSPFVLQPPVDGGPQSAPEDTPASDERREEPADDPREAHGRADDEPPTGAEAAGPEDAEAGDLPPPSETAGPPKMRIDLDGIQDRVVAFPVSEGLYGRIRVAHDGRVLYSRYPFESAIERAGDEPDAFSNGVVYTYNFEEGREEALISGVSYFMVSADGRTLVYRSGSRLRAVKAGEKPGNEGYSFTRRSGWIDLGRVKLEVLPGEEWRQMLREAWRLQRDQFWTEDMSRVDWLAVYERYLPLVERVGSRSEFSDLVLEMQGELGTSHTYEYGGDYRPAPRYSQGRLAAEYAYNPELDAWRIEHIYRGDVWDENLDSPLCQPGIQTEVGDYLLAVNGRRLGRTFSPAQALVNLAGENVLLTLATPLKEPEGENHLAAARNIMVRALSNDGPVRYREWVDENRRLVHKASAGRLGYVHIPDMGPGGYAEFHRGFLAEVDRDGLIVDVRFNRGGHVSSLILEKLARRRLAYITSRWRQSPQTYPYYAVAGPIVALTNEFAGSDGDIFSHAFKLMKIGPLVGTRTWGGVIGISPSGALVDGSVVTQPEFAPWFSDIGRGLENFGAVPDIEVDIRPQDYARGGDPQLERAVAEALRLLAENPPVVPDFSRPPGEATPKLPEA